jgi:hypothetical protein
LQANGLPHNFPSVRLGTPLSALYRAVLPVALLIGSVWTASNALALTAIKAGNRPDAQSSMPMMLKVLKRSTSPNSTLPQNPTVVPAPTQNSSDDDTAVPNPQSFGFLRFVSSKKEFYVGELVPVELKAFFRAGVELRVDGLPKLNSDAFTMNKLSDQPARSEQSIGGVPYTVLTWSTALTAVKAGDYEMSVELPTTVTVHQRAQPSHTRQGNPFGDPFFDDFFNDAFFDRFFGSASQKEVALSSEPSAVKILSVPVENRPASFTGAVGKFELAAEAAPLQAAVGDPVTLKLKISGSGNFERANAPALEKNDQWKTYKPSARFEPDDTSPCSGTKTFEQALVPVKSGQLTIPSLAFSYFDPESKRYVTRTTPPLSIQVAASTLSSSTLSAGTLSPSGTLSAANPASALVPNKLSPGRFHSTLRPWFLNPWLAAGALLPSLGLLAAYWFIRRRQELARDPQRLRLAEAQRAMQAQLRTMENAATQGATLEFFTAARGALQNQLGVHWGLLPQTITLAEINARMNGEADGFRFVFELADEVTYSGRTFVAAELQKWHKAINAELKKLERT